MEIKNLQNVTDAIGGNYPNKLECMRLAKALSVHANGEMPEDVILGRRPHESDEIKEYRKKIYVPKTKNPISKVIHSLEKIRRAQDWNIQYNADAKQSQVAEDEELEKYCEQKYPSFTSITNWAFSELLRNSLIDANGIVAVVLEDIPKNKSEYCKPIAKFFECSQIIEYVEDDYVVLKSKDVTSYAVNAGKGKRYLTNGAIYYVLTKNEYIKYEQTGGKQYTVKDIYKHNIGKLPAWKVGGLFKARKNNDTIYESRLAGMVPDLDEAAREYSDLQAEIVQHIHSERYAYTSTECPDCIGTGHITGKDGKKVQCPRCGGTGHILNKSPYGDLLIDAARAGELQVPTPPVGYIQKGTEIAKLQDERVRNHIKDALAAVNMEFLAETPIDQSGVAKAYDANELNNFVNAVAEDLVRNLDNVYFFINEYRYIHVVPQLEKRKAMLPSINVPTKFDIANTTLLMQELQGAKQAEVNPETMRVLETNYAKMQFNTQPEVSDKLQAIFDLDPLFGIKDEDKMTMLQNGGITELSYIISCNIHAFVTRAVFENKDFYSWDFKKKMDKLTEYAEDVKAEAKKKAEESANKEFDLGGLNNKGGKGDKPDDNNGGEGQKDGEGEKNKEE